MDSSVSEIIELKNTQASTVQNFRQHFVHLTVLVSEETRQIYFVRLCLQQCVYSLNAVYRLAEMQIVH